MEKRYAWQNSWGLSTRTIGVCVMVHGDDKGLVLPPRVAPVQVVVVPIISTKFSSQVVDSILSRCEALKAVFKKAEIRVEADVRSDKSPGWKYNYWEQKGVPLRIEIGEKELTTGDLCFVRRESGERKWITKGLEIAEGDAKEVVEQIKAEFDDIHQTMLDKARRERDERTSVVWTFSEFIEALGKGNLVLAPWSLTTESEEWVKEETQKLSKLKFEGAEGSEENEKGESKQLTGAAKTLCIPFNQPPLPKGTKCFTGSGKEAKQWCLWGRSY